MHGKLPLLTARVYDVRSPSVIDTSADQNLSQPRGYVAYQVEEHLQTITVLELFRPEWHEGV